MSDIGDAVGINIRPRSKQVDTASQIDHRLNEISALSRKNFIKISELPANDFTRLRNRLQWK